MTFYSIVKEGTSELLYSVDGKTSIQSCPVSLMLYEELKVLAVVLFCVAKIVSFLVSQVFYSIFATPLEQRCFTLKGDFGHQIVIG